VGGHRGEPPYGQPVQPAYGPHGPQGPGEPYGPGMPGMLPSRVKTVLITLFFGLFGLIPAYIDGRKAERQGASPGRYYVAFGITLAASVVVYAVLVVALVLTVFATAGDSSSASGPPFGAVEQTPPDTAVEAPPAGLATDAFVADWDGPIQGSGERSGELSLQMGQSEGLLAGGSYYSGQDCSGLWDEVSRDATSITVREEIYHDNQGVCASGATLVLKLDTAGRMLVDGGSWTAVLEAYPD
jgi:hypothetical protein